MSIHYQKFGQGAPLIVIHGLFGTSDNLKQVAKALSAEFTVYLIDAPSHGESGTINPLDYPSMAKQLLNFADEHNLATFSLLGHSMGGKIAMELALQHNERVNKLVVADIAPVQYPRRHDEIIAALQSVPLSSLANRQQADAALAEKIPEAGVRGFLLKSLVRNGEQGWKWKFDLTNIVEHYDNIVYSNSDKTYPGPTLFIIGGASDYVQMTHKTEIASRFSNVQAKTIQGAGHWLHAEKPVAFCKIARDFLLD